MDFDVGWCGYKGKLCYSETLWVLNKLLNKHEGSRTCSLGDVELLTILTSHFLNLVFSMVKMVNGICLQSIFITSINIINIFLFYLLIETEFLCVAALAILELTL